MPEESNPDKVESMVNLGAEIVFCGEDFEDARLKAEQMARDHGMYYVHPANEPLLIAGVGTYGLEIVEDLPEVPDHYRPHRCGERDLWNVDRRQVD